MDCIKTGVRASYTELGVFPPTALIVSRKILSADRQNVVTTIPRILVSSHFQPASEIKHPAILTLRQVGNFQT